MWLSTFLHCLVLATATQAADSWSFSDATVSVKSRMPGTRDVTEKFSTTSPVAKPLPFSSSSTLSVSLTLKENGQPKRPHQGFLLLSEPTTGVEAPFPLTIQSSGKAKLTLVQKDIPVQFIAIAGAQNSSATAKPKPLKGSLVLGSFGTATPLYVHVFDIAIQRHPNDGPAPVWQKPLRYGQKPEIRHTFRPDSKSPPKIVSLVFTFIVLACLPLLGLGMMNYGANVNHLSNAMSNAPLSHALFVGSIVGIESLLALYYSHWTLGKLLPFVAAFGVVGFLSGMKALGEVQGRRLDGVR